MPTHSGKTAGTKMVWVLVTTIINMAMVLAIMLVHRQRRTFVVSLEWFTT
jgi:cell division protein FtsL